MRERRRCRQGHLVGGAQDDVEQHDGGAPLAVGVRKVDRLTDRRRLPHACAAPRAQRRTLRAARRRAVRRRRIHRGHGQRHAATPTAVAGGGAVGGGGSSTLVGASAASATGGGAGASRASGWAVP